MGSGCCKASKVHDPLRQVSVSRQVSDADCEQVIHRATPECVVGSGALANSPEERVSEDLGPTSQLRYGVRHVPSREMLLSFLGPGDILVMDVKAKPSLMAGHTLLCLSTAQWNHALRMYQIETAECTRQESPGAFYKTTHLLSPLHAQTTVVGELLGPGDVNPYADQNTFRVLLQPATLRSKVSMNVFTKVAEDVEKLWGAAEWSASTAVTAAVRAAQLQAPTCFWPQSSVLEEVQSGWTAGPICTSVIAMVWQRCLVEVAADDEDASALIMEFMPVHAGRSLPSDLVYACRKCGWIEMRF